MISTKMYTACFIIHNANISLQSCHDLCQASDMKVFAPEFDMHIQQVVSKMVENKDDVATICFLFLTRSFSES